MKFRCFPSAAAAAVLATALAMPAAAQTPPAATDNGWQFSLTPYVWLPHVSGSATLDTPEFGPKGLSAKIGPDSYLKDLRLAAMLSGEARKDGFVLASDFIYLNLHGSSARVESVTLPVVGSVPVRDTGTTMNGQSVIWTGGAGYNVVRNDILSVDVLAGFRFMSTSSTVNWNLSLAGGLVNRSGSVSRTQSLADGIVAVKGSVKLSDTGFYIPFYADIGAGPASFTWQAGGGLAYAFGWGDVSLMYRYLQFQTTNNTPIQRLGMGGPMIGVRFTF